MSSRYNYGAFDTLNGKTAIELSQSRVGTKIDSIRKPGFKIDVMSDEEWNQLAKVSDARRRQKDAQIQQDLKQQHTTVEEVATKTVTSYFAMVNSQREYVSKLAKMLKAYYKTPDGDETSRQEWEAAYAEVGRFLAAVLVAFHFQMDRTCGVDVQGPGIQDFRDAHMKGDVPNGHWVHDYIAHRQVSVSVDEEKYLKSLVDRRVSQNIFRTSQYPSNLTDYFIEQFDLPIFILVACEDNVNRIAQTEGSSLSAPKALFEFVIENNLIREEMIELVLENNLW
ncbi:hypothetical protein ACHAP8_007554 [Fusarium lateritium]